MDFRIILAKSTQYLVGIFIEIALNLHINFERIDTFTTLSLQSMNTNTNKHTAAPSHFHKSEKQKQSTTKHTYLVNTFLKERNDEYKRVVVSVREAGRWDGRNKVPVFSFLVVNSRLFIEYLPKQKGNTTTMISICHEPYSCCADCET